MSGSLVKVTTGMQNDDYVEILSGVSEGDVVLYTGSSSSSSSNMMMSMMMIDVYKRQGYTRLMTLYVPTADGRWLLPAVRTVAFSAGAAPIDCLYAALEQLGSMAPDSTTAQDMPAPMDYICLLYTSRCV